MGTLLSLIPKCRPDASPTTARAGAGMFSHCLHVKTCAECSGLHFFGSSCSREARTAYVACVQIYHSFCSRVFSMISYTAGFLSCGPLAQRVVHALKGLAQPRARSKGHVSAEHRDCLQCEAGELAAVTRARLHQFFSRTVRSQKRNFFSESKT